MQIILSSSDSNNQEKEQILSLNPIPCSSIHLTTRKSKKMLTSRLQRTRWMYLGDPKLEEQGIPNLFSCSKEWQGRRGWEDKRSLNPRFGTRSISTTKGHKFHYFKYGFTHLKWLKDFTVDLVSEQGVFFLYKSLLWAYFSNWMIFLYFFLIDFDMMYLFCYMYWL